MLHLFKLQKCITEYKAINQRFLNSVAFFLSQGNYLYFSASLVVEKKLLPTVVHSHLRPSFIYLYFATQIT